MAGSIIFIHQPGRTIIGPPRIRKEAQLFSVLRREEGQGLAEYALILALICLVVVAAVALFGLTVDDMFNNIATQFGSL
jgi:pilus assembly protein Flp/PilA